MSCVALWPAIALLAGTCVGVAWPGGLTAFLVTFLVACGFAFAARQRPGVCFVCTLLARGLAGAALAAHATRTALDTPDPPAETAPV